MFGIFYMGVCFTIRYLLIAYLQWRTAASGKAFTNMAVKSISSRYLLYGLRRRV